MMASLDIWKLLGGLGVFLFAMHTLEEAIKNLAGRSFRRFIRERTEGRMKSILSGTLITAILQSSSAVSLMVLSFVGAGIMAMDNAIGVILGSNIGTTATAWIVATFGFKLNIESLALPLIGIGGLILIFLGKSERYSSISKLLVSFGFIFVGLAYMKQSMDGLTESFSFDDLPKYGIFFYLLIGIILTAAMQSSSGSIAIILTGLNAELISFEYAAAMVIGANIGTTATVMIGGLRAVQIKKRVAFSHLIFNLITAIVGFTLLWPIIWLIKEIIGPIKENAVLGIALFQTIFNILGVIVFIPFIPLFSRLLIKYIPDKTTLLTHHIHDLSASVPDAGIAGIRKEIRHLINRSMKHNLTVFNIPLSEVYKGKQRNNDARLIKEKIDYNNLKLLQAEIFMFASEIQQQPISKENSTELNRLLHAARTALHAAKSLKDVKHNIVDFEMEDNEFLMSINVGFRLRLVRLYTNLLNVMSIENHTNRAGEMAHILYEINNEDGEFVKNVMNAVSQKELMEIQVSEALLVNRAYIQSAKQIFSSILELLLTENEIILFERLTENHQRKDIV